METVMSKEHTEELLQRARAGDREAFDQLAGRYRQDLLAFSESRLGPAVRGQLEPEDVTQDALVKAFQALNRFESRGPDSFRRWLCAIAEHLIRNAGSSGVGVRPVFFIVEPPRRLGRTRCSRSGKAAGFLEPAAEQESVSYLGAEQPKAYTPSR